LDNRRVAIDSHSRDSQSVLYCHYPLRGIEVSHDFCSVGLKPDPSDGYPLLQPGYVRLYEFLHGYEDIPIEEWQAIQQATKDDPLMQILAEEVQKEINKEVVRMICEKARQ
jgi:hypothetical protein